jgi:predicted RNA methylase
VQKTIVIAYREDNLNSKVLAWMESQANARRIAVHFSEAGAPMLSNAATAIGAKRVYMIEGEKEQIENASYRAKKIMAIAEKEDADIIAVDEGLSKILSQMVNDKKIIKIVSPEAQL